MSTTYDLDSLYGAVLAANIPHDTNASDLYLPDRPDVCRMVDSYNRSFSTFMDQRTGAASLDVAFAYLPFWDARRAPIEAASRASSRAIEGGA